MRRLISYAASLKQASSSRSNHAANAVGANHRDREDAEARPRRRNLRLGDQGETRDWFREAHRCSVFFACLWVNLGRRAASVRLRSGLVLVLLTPLGGAGLAGSAPSASVAWWSVGGGGGVSATEGIVLQGSVGQATANPLSGGSVSVSGGFWPALRRSQVQPPPLIAWTNWHGGKFSVAANWNPNRVPGPADTAVLDTLKTSYTVTIDADYSLAGLTLGPSVTVAGTGRLTVAGAFNWTGGVLNSFVQCNGGMVNGTATHTLNGGRLLNAGLLQLASSLNTAGSAAITNLSGAILEVTDDVTIDTAGVIENQGTLRKTGGSGTATIRAKATNRSVLETHRGTLAFTAPYVQTAGSTLLAEGQLRVDQGMSLAAGLLTGTNVVSGAVTNSGGIVAPYPSPGSFTINGRYVQTAGGTLAIALAGPNPGTDFDVLTVLGVVKLGGSFKVKLLNGYVPPDGTSFEFLPAASCLGTFAAFEPPLDSLGLTIIYAPDHVALFQGEPPPRIVPQYALVDLGGLATLGCSPQAINNHGQVVGFAQVTGGYHAFRYDPGRMTDLGVLAGPNSYAYGVNDAGHVVGWSTSTAPRLLSTRSTGMARCTIWARCRARQTSRATPTASTTATRSSVTPPWPCLAVKALIPSSIATAA